jgi:hypothetical protein
MRTSPRLPTPTRIDEALNARTTDISDNQLAGAGLDGSAYLPAALSSHHPLDLVIIMLGTNDLKAAYNRSPYRIALGAAHLIDICNTIDGGIGTISLRIFSQRQPGWATTLLLLALNLAPTVVPTTRVGDDNRTTAVGQKVGLRHVAYRRVAQFLESP